MTQKMLTIEDAIRILRAANIRDRRTANLRNLGEADSTSPPKPNTITMQPYELHPSIEKTWKQFYIHARNVAHDYEDPIDFRRNGGFGQLRHELSMMHALWTYLTEDLKEDDCK